MKIFKKMSKKIMALLLSVSLLFSNVMPIATVFALTEDEKEDLVELRMRRATGIDIDNGEATIHYDGGEATVTGNDLYHVEDNHWDYGDGNYGVMHILYTSSTNLTFHFYSDEGMQVSINFSGNPPESPNNNEWTVNNLLLRNQRAEGYDLEFQFAPEINGSGGGVSMPNGSSYQVEFGNASWNLDNVNVTASIQGKDLTDGFLSVVDNEVIELTNYDPETMEVRVSTRDGFSIELFVDEHNTTCLGWTIGGVLPPEDLYFNVQPRAAHNAEGVYSVEFGDAEWNIDGEYVTASLEDNNIVLTEGPVEIGAHDAIHLEGFNHETMVAVVETQDGFRAELFVDESNNTSIDQTPPEVYVPNDDTLFFFVDFAGPHEPGNPPQEGNQTAIIRVNGIEGTYTDMEINPITGEEEEIQRPYDGRGSIANETRFNVNDGNVWMLLPEGETEEEETGHYLYNEIEYNYEGEETDSTISLGLFTPWHLKFSNIIKINGASYQVSNFINYNDKSSWLSHINNDVVGFNITVPKAEDNIYEITVQVDFNPVEYLSEFRWTNDPEEKYGIDEQGQPTEELNPAYLEHVKLEIVNVQFSVGAQSYNYNEANFSTSEFGDDFIAYRSGRHGEYAMGELFVPSDTTVTLRLTPDPGYQVTELDVPGGFTVGDNPMEYTFILPNFYDQFNVVVEECENDADSYNEDIEDVGITLPAAVSINGNYEIVVDELDNQSKTAFSDQLNGYTPNIYFNLALNQILYQADLGNWTVPITNISKKATVVLTLENEINADNMILIHNRGNGNFETITPTVNGKVVTFDTKHFGDYVLASMSLQAIEGVSVTVAPPTAGETVHVSMHHAEGGDYPEADIVPGASVPNNAPYAINGTAWVNGNCAGGSGTCNEFFNGTFDQNGAYFARISIRANDGYKLTYDILNDFTVNGHELDTDNGDAIISLTSTEFVFVTKVAAGGNEPPVMKGDLNGNGRIDLADIIALLKAYLSGDDSNEILAVGDMNGNTRIDLSDIIALLKAYLAG